MAILKKKKVLDQAANGVVHQHITNGNIKKKKVLDQAANGVVHQHITNGNIICVLAPNAPTDKLGYSKKLNQVE